MDQLTSRDTSGATRNETPSFMTPDDDDSISLDEIEREGRSLLDEPGSPVGADLWIAKVRSLFAASVDSKDAALRRIDQILGESASFPFESNARADERSMVSGILDVLDAETTSAQAGPYSASSLTQSVFVSHSGESNTLSRLLRFVSACGLVPLVAEREPFAGATVPDHVRRVMKRCSAAILLAETTQVIEGGSIPGSGVLVEAGILQERLGDRIIYLVEEGVALGAMVSPFAYTRFQRDCLEQVFERLVIEFRAMGMM